MQQILWFSFFIFFLYSLFNVFSLYSDPFSFTSTCISSGVRWIIDLSWWKAIPFVFITIFFLLDQKKSNEKIIPIWLILVSWIFDFTVPVTKKKTQLHCSEFELFASGSTCGALPLCFIVAFLTLNLVDFYEFMVGSVSLVSFSFLSGFLGFLFFRFRFRFSFRFSVFGTLCLVILLYWK
jgi:hypothetical protein